MLKVISKDDVEVNSTKEETQITETLVFDKDNLSLVGLDSSSGTEHLDQAPELTEAEINEKIAEGALIAVENSNIPMQIQAILKTELPAIPTNPDELSEFVKKGNGVKKVLEAFIAQENHNFVGYKLVLEKEKEIINLVVDTELKISTIIAQGVKEGFTKEKMYTRLCLTSKQGQNISKLTQEKVDFARKKSDEDTKVTRTHILKLWDKKEEKEQLAKEKQERVERSIAAISSTKIIRDDESYNLIYAAPFMKDLDLDVEDVRSIDLPASDDAMLYIWSPADKLMEALDIITTWGFEYKTHIVWNTGLIGSTNLVKNKHQLLLIASKGKGLKENSTFTPVSIYEGRVQDEPDENDEKQYPDYIPSALETQYPEALYLEVFSNRGYSNKWTVF